MVPRIMAKKVETEASTRLFHTVSASPSLNRTL
jgi:hypothetical protein